MLVCRLHMEFPGDLVHSLPQMRMPVPAYCRRRSLSLRFASAKVLKGCFCTMLSSRLSVWPSGCTWSEQKYSEHAGHGLSLGALFSSSHLSAKSPKHLLQYLALMVWNRSFLSTVSSSLLCCMLRDCQNSMSSGVHNSPSSLDMRGRQASPSFRLQRGMLADCYLMVSPGCRPSSCLPCLELCKNQTPCERICPASVCSAPALCCHLASDACPALERAIAAFLGKLMCLQCYKRNVTGSHAHTSHAEWYSLPA